MLREVVLKFDLMPGSPRVILPRTERVKAFSKMAAVSASSLANSAVRCTPGTPGNHPGPASKFAKPGIDFS